MISDEAIYGGAFWGLITNAFVHIEPIHLIFNLYWLYILGGAFERTFGPVRTILFFLLTAAVTSGIQLYEGAGIGLSGIGYALFGFGWLVRRRFPEFARVVTDRTIAMFVIWGVACIYLTYTRVMNIGNAAHFSGLALGAALGAMIVLPELRLALVSALVVLVSGSVAATMWNPRSLYWVANQAEAAQRNRDYDRAERLYRSTLRLDANPEWVWYSLAELYGESNNPDGLRSALRELEGITPADARYLENRYKHVLRQTTSSEKLQGKGVK